MLTGRLQSWVSDIDAAALEADERMQAIVGSIGAAGQAATRGEIGDEDPLQAVADALAVFPADALILAVRAPTSRTGANDASARRSAPAQSCP
jgi:hypothetical protein